uniref:NADH-ubiquinone oxidoreductase chain 3 n=1 Tax=Hyaloraphidium curvatum TaxID=82268 RepID=Q950T4_HYACU|nr:NADH dehydrogenase subunit 3 [Hyaloraphidium curvatum]AAK83432.1 NADH dehydrogenase subunit 3 [Hyaloraphidium curvatum]
MVAFISLLLLVVVLLVASLYLSVSSRTADKLSTYECGFDPYSDARLKFDILYYLVAILFLLFDLEVIFLFPFATLLTEMSFWNLSVYLIFFSILTIGYLYELNSGSLEL